MQAKAGSKGLDLQDEEYNWGRLLVRASLWGCIQSDHIVGFNRNQAFLVFPVWQKSARFHLLMPRTFLGNFANWLDVVFKSYHVTHRLTEEHHWFKCSLQSLQPSSSLFPHSTVCRWTSGGCVTIAQVVGKAPRSANMTFSAGTWGCFYFVWEISISWSEMFPGNVTILIQIFFRKKCWKQTLCPFLLETVLSSIFKYPLSLS